MLSRLPTGWAYLGDLTQTVKLIATEMTAYTNMKVHNLPIVIAIVCDNLDRLSTQKKWISLSILKIGKSR